MHSSDAATHDAGYKRGQLQQMQSLQQLYVSDHLRAQQLLCL